jgi:protein gp37
MKEEWVIEIKENCSRSNVPFFFKQWGGFNKKKSGNVLQGKVWDEMPLSYRNAI